MSESGDRMDTTDITKVDPAPSQSEPGEVALTVKAARVNKEEEAQREVVFDVRDAGVFYGEFQALRDVSLPILKNQITALIGPSGCGKTTFIRCLNRMNDLIEGARVDGKFLYHGIDLYDPDVDPVEVRRHIGMVFQKPNPFPKSIYDNIAFGPKIAGMKVNMDDLVEECLHRGRAVGRGQGQTEGIGPGPVRRAAAATLHRACDRDEAGCDPDG